MSTVSASKAQSGYAATAAADRGHHLLRELKRSRHSDQLRALGLILPLLCFLLAVYLIPIGMLLSRSVWDPSVADGLPTTVAALARWRGEGDVPLEAFTALVADLKAGEPQKIGKVAARLNMSVAGMRSLIMSTKVRLASASGEDARETLLRLSSKWGAKETWATIQQADGPLTDFYMLAALDLRRTVTGDIAQAPSEERVFVSTIRRTFEMAMGVSMITLVIGFPFAYLAATASDRVARLLLFAVLLPFWTSILVRTLSWSVLLQRTGIINDALMRIGLIHEPLDLIYNRFAVYVALVHIFLPYMVLPLYSVMKTVPAAHMRAAASLGARPWTAFRRIYLPQVAPGIGAGALLVFIQCLGVFVVPALLGGPDDQGISNSIAFYVKNVLNWGLASALSVVLLISVAIFYALFARLSGKTSMTIG